MRSYDVVQITVTSTRERVLVTFYDTKTAIVLSCEEAVREYDEQVPVVCSYKVWIMVLVFVSGLLLINIVLITVILFLLLHHK